MTLFQLDAALFFFPQPSGGTEQRNIRINYVVIHPRRCSCAKSNSVSASPLALRPDCQWVAACVAGRMPLPCRRVVGRGGGTVRFYGYIVALTKKICEKIRNTTRLFELLSALNSRCLPVASRYATFI